MFKKPIKVGAQNQLSGKDRKSIKNKMSQLFDEKCIEALFARNEKIISAKVTGSKMMIYNGDDYPLFVDGTGKHDYFPSVYTCQAYQPLLKCLDINEGVENFVFNGANLMWPGVSDFQKLGDFKKDQVIGIRSAKGEIIAVGALGCSLEEFNKNEDKSGVATYILHYKSDKLWDSGPKFPIEAIIAEEVEEEVKKQEEKIQEPTEETKAAEKEEEPIKEEQTKAENPDIKDNKKDLCPEPVQESESSDEEEEEEAEIGSLLHKGSEKPVIQMEETKKPTIIDDSDEDRGKKGKKKGGKKKNKGKRDSDEDEPQPKGKKQVEEEEQMIEKPGKNKRGKKKQAVEEDEEEMVEKVSKNRRGKKRHAIQDQDDEEEMVENAGKGKRGKKGKGKEKEKEKREKRGSDDEEEGETQAKEEEVKEISAISDKIMDGYLRESFLNALKLSKVQGQLPIDSGRFYMDYILLARPEGVKLEIKQSSYKKLGKFYEEMAKQKLIEFKHAKDKKGQQGSTITKILYDTDDFKNFVPTIKRMGEKDVEIKLEGNMKAAKLRLAKTLKVENVYTPHEMLYNALYHKKIDYLADIDEDQPKKKEKKAEFFSEAELREQMNIYINKISENKIKTQKQVLIDYKKHEFIGILLDKEIREFEENMAEEEINKAPQNSDEEEEGKKGKKGKKDKKRNMAFRIDREYLINKMLKKTVANHHILDKQNGIDSFKQGTFKGIQLFAEKANNKNVTRIVGLQIFIIPKEEADRQINSLSQMFQQKFACSVNVMNLPGRNAGKEIILHGTFVDPLEQFFLMEYGIRKDFITTVNKLDKKKKNH